MDPVVPEALRLLAGLRHDICVFCRRPSSGEGEPPDEFEVLGKRYTACKGSLKSATDLRGRVIEESDIIRELVESETLQCCLCGRSRASMICPNVKQCGNKYHWSCRLDQVGEQKDAIWHCSECRTSVTARSH